MELADNLCLFVRVKERVIPVGKACNRFLEYGAAVKLRQAVVRAVGNEFLYSFVDKLRRVCIECSLLSGFYGRILTLLISRRA